MSSVSQRRVDLCIVLFSWEENILRRKRGAAGLKQEGTLLQEKSTWRFVQMNTLGCSIGENRCTRGTWRLPYTGSQKCILGLRSLYSLFIFTLRSYNICVPNGEKEPGLFAWRSPVKGKCHVIFESFLKTKLYLGPTVYEQAKTVLQKFSRKSCFRVVVDYVDKRTSSFL